MKTLYLHIGMHKTGTTALQNFLFQNKQLLKKYNLNYFSSSPTDYRFGDALKYENDQEYVLKTIKKFRDVEEENLLLSCEVFIEDGHIPSLLDKLFIQERIYELFQVKIIIYIRRADYWLESAYNQKSKTLKNKGQTFEEFFLDKNLDYYLNRFFIWGNIFGKDNIIVKVFQENRDDDWLFRDCLQILNLKLTNEFIIPPRKDQNRSIDPHSIKTLNIAKELFETQKQIDSFIEIVSKYQDFNTNSSFIKPERRKEILALYQSTYALIAQKFLGIEFGQLFNDEIPAQKNVLSESDQLKETIKLLSKTIISQCCQNANQVPLNKKSEIDQLAENKTNEEYKSNSKIQHKSIVNLQSELSEKDILISEKEETIEKLNESLEEYKRVTDLLSAKIKEKEGIIVSKKILTDNYFKELSDLKNSAVFKFNDFLKRVSIYFNPKKITAKLKHEKRLAEWCKIIEESGYFDPVYYKKENPDVAISGTNPTLHFLLYGGFELRNPSENFDVAHYVGNNPSIMESRINPLIHYLNIGKKDGFEISDVSKNNTKSPDFIKDWIYNDIDDKRRISHEIELIRESGLFNEKYYFAKYPDIKSSGIDPVEHYYFDGWKEMRNPSSEFDTRYYLESDPFLEKSGYNPLIHYIKFGMDEKRFTKFPEIDEEKQIQLADISDIDQIDTELNSIKIAVVCHLYYPDLISEFLKYLNNIQNPFDLFISTKEENVEIARERFKELIHVKNLNVFTFNNIGRDIYPYVILHKEYLTHYDLVCKIHSKKSLHEINLINWRTYLMDNLLGSEKIVYKIITEFKNDQELGMVYPATHPFISHYKGDIGWGENFMIAKKHFNEFIPEEESTFRFPSGSMFWYRPIALKLIHTISEDDFEEEVGKTDGTLAHTIERMFGIFPLVSGYKLKKAFFSDSIRRLSNNSLTLLKNRQSILFITHDLFLAGAEMLLLSIMRWIIEHTSIKIHILALRQGNDGGKLFKEYNKISKVVIWEDLRTQYSENEISDFFLKNFSPIDLIYGNSILSPEIYRYLKILNAPYITHIHELEESIKRYVSRSTLDDMKKYTNFYIPCSEAVQINLIENHNIPSGKMHYVNAFIQLDISVNVEPLFIRKQFSLPVEKTIIWGCGTIYWRKGTDLFIQTAKHLLDMGLTDFQFIWIGWNYWKIESDGYRKWVEWEKYIIENGLENHVSFLGEIENPKQYFLAGDIFYLPSREDPFPLVCLEAAECQLPVVCFDDAGGMPSFIEDNAGFVVPYLDTLAAANEIKFLIENESVRKQKGKVAREKLLQRHSSDKAVPEILKICHQVMNTQPLLTVFVPVFNQAKFIKERIESILNQTFRDYEIIIIDDCSTDNSFEIIKSFEYHPSISVYRNEKNSGSVFRQWQRGIQKANGKYIWIAEGDDVADSKFLETLLPAFNDHEVNLCYCASNTIDENGFVDEEHYLNVGHYNNLNFPKNRWLDTYTTSGNDEIVNALSIRNTIPNASAVLVRLDAAKNIDFDKCSTFTCGGDWFAYVSIIKDGKIHYSPKHLNYHRIHLKSVVGQNKLKAENTIPDYFEMHKYILKQFIVPENVRNMMIQSVSNGLRNLWPELDDVEFKKLYNDDELKQFNSSVSK